VHFEPIWIGAPSTDAKALFSDSVEQVVPVAAGVVVDCESSFFLRLLFFKKPAFIAGFFADC